MMHGRKASNLILEVSEYGIEVSISRKGVILIQVVCVFITDTALSSLAFLLRSAASYHF